MKTFKTLVFDLFYLLIGAYVALMFLEYFKPGLVSNYVDLNKILYFLAPIGVLCVLVSNKKVKNNINNEEKKYD